MVVERTERGDDMFMTASRATPSMAIDLDALALLPEPGPGARAPLRPEPGRRGPPPRRGPSSSGTRAGTSTPSPTTAALGALPAASGRLRTSARCLLYTAFVVRPGEPAIMRSWSSRRRCRRPGRRQAIDDRAARAEQSASEPLSASEVSLEGPRRPTTTPSAPLRGGGGRAGRARRSISPGRRPASPTPTASRPATRSRAA